MIETGEKKKKYCGKKKNQGKNKKKKAKKEIWTDE